jgi:long-chain-fatty-acid--CoA ligase ACSBG
MFLDAANELPNLKAIIIWDVTDTSEVENFKAGDRTIRVIRWSQLAAIAEETEMSIVEERMASQESGHCCSYIYTSGTTGRPKAVMISHDNIIFEVENVIKIIPNGRDDCEERMLSFLPLSHVAGMMVDIIAPMVITSKGGSWGTVYFARNYDLSKGTVADRLRCVKPTLFLGVPRVWEKIAEKMKAVGAKTTGLKKIIATWAKAKGLAHQSNCQLGGNGAEPFMYGFAESVILSKVKAALGLECCKFGFTGAAPITTDTLEYFGALGININEVYGMSECTGATTWSTDEAHVWGSCGWAMEGTEVKIFRVAEGTDGNTKTECPRAQVLGKPTEEEQGEICFRGRHIMLGYMANPNLGEEHVAEINKKNSDAIDDEGWLHSGDKGCMDTRGMVKITGRYKELIVTAGGENIAPVPIEDNIKKLCGGVSNVIMIGDKRKFNVAVITLKAVGAEGEDPGTDDLNGGALTMYDGQAEATTTISAATSDDKLIAAIQAAVDATNSDESCCTNNASKIQKWTILPHDFSVKGGELTPTLKTKRAVVMTNFEAAIDAMYASKEKYVKFVPNKE